jgi:phage I-like protein
MKDGLTQATALPIWDPAGLALAAQKMGGEPPTWMQVFPYPTYDCTIDGEKKTLVTDDVSQESIVDEFEEMGNDLVIDYEHATTKPGVYYAPAGGRIVDIVAGGKLGLLARVEWTEQAADEIRTGKYFYDSPTFGYSPEDWRVYRLVALALTNMPGSYNRMELTEHTEKNYAGALERHAAKAAPEVSATTRPLTIVCAKWGGVMKKTLQQTIQKLTEGAEKIGAKFVESAQKLTDSVLSNMRYAFDLPLTTTGNELVGLLTAIIAQVPATDDPIFIVEDSQKSAKTLGEVFGLATEKSEPLDLTPLRHALSVTDEKADVPALALAVLSLKANTVPLSRVRELEGQLASVSQKSVKERTDLLIANNRAKIRPEKEEEIRELAEKDFTMAEKFVGMLPALDLTSQSQDTAPPAPKTESPKGDVVSESKSAHERTLEIAQEKKVSYREANEIRKTEEAAAAAKKK